MREPLRDKERLNHILEAIGNIQQYVQHVDDYVSLREDKIRFHATSFNIQIIGEAVYKLSHDFKERHKETQWDVIEKMRHVIVHDYYHVNPEILWDTIQNDLPVLKSQVEKYLAEL